MNKTVQWAPLLAALAFLTATSPALAQNGKQGQGQGHGKGGGNSGGGKGNGGGAKGTPAPIAGLGIVALGAIGYGTRRLQKQKNKQG